ncbi:MAG TPA: FAD-dependent oxidoreductase [Patescibacteria group bacterium]|nr:FAD-dependent oxidoreductase [Patescibacteria group bacterium]
MKIKLVKKTEEAKGTISFFWETEKPVEYLPGQYFYYTLPKLNYPDPRGTTRHFTISSSPTEGKLLRLTTRIREESGFKKTLDELTIGAEIEGEGPNGTFILDENDQGMNHVFLAGGIGITPFRAFIKYNVDKNLKIPMHLIYSNSNSDFVYKKELEDWAKNYDFVKVYFFDTSKSGHLEDKNIKDLVATDLLSSVFWTVGPPPYVDAMEVALNKLKVASENIRSEKFTGY